MQVYQAPQTVIISFNLTLQLLAASVWQEDIVIPDASEGSAESWGDWL